MGVRQSRLLVRQTAVFDVEVGVEERGTLRPKKGRLRLDPLAWLHFAGVGDEAGIQLAHDLGMLVGDVVFFFRVVGDQIVGHDEDDVGLRVRCSRG